MRCSLLVEGFEEHQDGNKEGSDEPVNKCCEQSQDQNKRTVVNVEDRQDRACALTASLTASVSGGALGSPSEKSLNYRHSPIMFLMTKLHLKNIDFHPKHTLTQAGLPSRLKPELVQILAHAVESTTEIGEGPRGLHSPLHGRQEVLELLRLKLRALERSRGESLLLLLFSSSTSAILADSASSLAAAATLLTS